MYDNIDNMTVLFNIQNFNNINVQNDRLHDVDPDHNQPFIILRDEAIQQVIKAKFLGVIVDQHLNWKDHISMVSHKISKSCGIISRIRNTLDCNSKKKIYYSRIHPYLTYCINVWSSI